MHLETNTPLDLTFIVFWILSFPTATVSSYGGFLALRFFLGFFGSPALANGGATVGDLFSLIYIPYGLSFWVLSAWCGPAFGPLIGGFAAMAKGWRWPMWEVVWMSSPVLLVLLTMMPETSSATILLRRAQRLRKLTGDTRLQSQSEIDQQNMIAKEILFSTLVRPMEIMLKDPSIFFVNLYTGYFYGGKLHDLSAVEERSANITQSFTPSLKSSPWYSQHSTTSTSAKQASPSSHASSASLSLCSAI